MLGKIALATTATLALGAGSALAVLPPPPADGDTDGAATYLHTYDERQQKVIRAADGYADRAYFANSTKQKAKWHKKHQQQTRKFSANFQQYRAQTPSWAGCHTMLAIHHQFTKNDLQGRGRVLRARNLPNRAVASIEREVGFDRAATSFYAISTLACLVTDLNWPNDA